MGKEPILQLFSEAHCLGGRPEIAPIAGERVAIIGRHQDNKGTWSYTVYPSSSKLSATFECMETELIPSASEPLLPDMGRSALSDIERSKSELLRSLLASTSLVRFHRLWEEGRSALRANGIEPDRCVFFYTGPGGEYATVMFVGEDGHARGMDLNRGKATGSIVIGDQWPMDDEKDAEKDLAREVCAEHNWDDFDAQVREYYDQEFSDVKN
jgi:hypothetical protein